MAIKRYTTYGGAGGIRTSSKFGATTRVGKVHMSSGAPLIEKGKSKISPRNKFELMKYARFTSLFNTFNINKAMGRVFTKIQLIFSRILIRNIKASIRKGGWHPHSALTYVISGGQHPLLRDKRLMYNSVTMKPLSSSPFITSFWVGFPSNISVMSGSGKKSKLNLAKIARIHDQTGATIRVTEKMKKFFRIAARENPRYAKRLTYKNLDKKRKTKQVIVIKPRPFFDRAIEQTFKDFPLNTHFHRLFGLELNKMFSFMRL